MMAEDSMREQSMNQSRNLFFPKTIACQTEPVSLQSQPSQTTSLLEVACVASAKGDSRNENVPCPTEDCFCKASESRRGSSRWRGIFKVFGSVVFLLFIFTFFGGLEIDHSVSSYLVSFKVGCGGLVASPYGRHVLQDGCFQSALVRNNSKERCIRREGLP